MTHPYRKPPYGTEPAFNVCEYLRPVLLRIVVALFMYIVAASVVSFIGGVLFVVAFGQHFLAGFYLTLVAFFTLVFPTTFNHQDFLDVR